jgi:hypothetical protein
MQSLDHDVVSAHLEALPGRVVADVARSSEVRRCRRPEAPSGAAVGSRGGLPTGMERTPEHMRLVAERGAS